MYLPEDQDRYIAHVQQHPGWQSWVGCHLTDSGTTDSMVVAVCRPAWARCSRQLRRTQETSQSGVCINWGTLQCFRAPTWSHTLAGSQLLPIPIYIYTYTYTYTSPSLYTPSLPLQENLGLKVSEGCHETARPWPGQVGTITAQTRGDLQDATALKLRLPKLIPDFRIKMAKLKLALICIHQLHLLTALWTFLGRQSSCLWGDKISITPTVEQGSLSSMPEWGNTSTRI